MFVDETAAKTNMVRLRGRCARGQRLNAALPWGHWKAGSHLTDLQHPWQRIRACAELDDVQTGQNL